MMTTPVAWTDPERLRAPRGAWWLSAAPVVLAGLVAVVWALLGGLPTVGPGGPNRPAGASSTTAPYVYGSHANDVQIVRVDHLVEAAVVYAPSDGSAEFLGRASSSVAGFVVAPEAAPGVTRGADFIASSDGTVVWTSRARLEGGFRDAGFPSGPTTSPGMVYTLPDGSLVRVMEPSGQAGLRASFTDANGNAINPFTGKQPQPPPGVTGAAWKRMFRDLTHVDLWP